MENATFQQVVLEKLDALTEGQKRLETDVSDLKTDVSDLKTDVSDLKVDVRDLKTQINDMDTRLGNVEKIVEHIQVQTAGLLVFRTATQEAITEIVDTQDVMCSILGEHEVQIRRILKRIG